MDKELHALVCVLNRLSGHIFVRYEKDRFSERYTLFFYRKDYDSFLATLRAKPEIAKKRLTEKIVNFGYVLADIENKENEIAKF